MNEYMIVFKAGDGREISEIGRANNVMYAIENAKRTLARNGINVAGLAYVSHKLVRER